MQRQLDLARIERTMRLGKVRWYVLGHDFSVAVPGTRFRLRFAV